MSEHLNKQRCFIAVLSIVVVMLLIYSLIDLYAGWRDMHHIHDLQRRVGELEQRR